MKRFLSLLALVATLVAPRLASTHPEYATPTLTSDTVDCVDCHTSAPADCEVSVHPRLPCLNPFGKAYQADGWSPTVQSADSDGDGSLNSVEVGASGSAGFHQRAEALCDMGTCAQAPGTYTFCSSNVRCRANFFSSPVANYTFNFTCRPGTEGIASGTGTWGCVDVNECESNPCGEGVCLESPLNGWTSPGYSCSCELGYVFQGGTCVLNDECAAGLDDCDPLASCEDTAGEGNFTCTCPDGTLGDGRQSGTGCVDECSETPCAPGCETDAGACVDAGGDGGAGDSGAGFDDAGTTFVDAGGGLNDAGAASGDAGVAFDDAGAAEEDAGAPIHDAGAADTDSGPEPQDGGAVDASADPPSDAGPPPLAEDAGASARDAGSSSDGPLPDGGDGDDVGGCTCGGAGADVTADVTAASLLGLLFAALARRRKRKR